MSQKQPGHRALAQSVWSLIRITGGSQVVLGTFSTAEKARTDASKIIATEAGVRNIRVPIWAPKDGGFELIYGRDGQSWRFVVALHMVDGAIQ